MTVPGLRIDALHPGDSDALGRLFFDAVHVGAADFYDADQRRAWIAAPPSGALWAARLLQAQRTWVAHVAGEPVGFMTLADDGYIDLAFVAPGYQRRGVGDCIYTRIEAEARVAGITRLHSQASHLLKGLLDRRGWVVQRRQQVARAGVLLTNFVMEKHLFAPA